MSLKADMNRLRRDKEREGWSVTKTRSGHLRWTLPVSGDFFFTGSTPGDHRCLANIEAQIKRAEKRSAGEQNIAAPLRSRYN